MRIKNLATRATKLLTGNAYMVFDNGTKVEKVDYAELAKQIITEYNTQTLAGSAQSVKSALDALNSKTEWKLVGKVTGKSSLSLPSSYNELYILLQYGNQSGFTALSFSFSIPYSLTTSVKTLTDGYYFDSSSNGFVQVYVSRTEAHIVLFKINGTDYSDTSEMDVYYR